MPVVPSFTGFAPTPNAAQAYGAGASARLGYANIAQRAQESAAQLAQQRQLAEMEYQAKTQQFAKETALKQQELEIEKAYREGIMRMQEGQLQTQQGVLALNQLKAEREFGAQRQLEAQIPTIPGDPLNAYLRLGPRAGAQLPSGMAARGAPLIPPKEVIGPGGKRYIQYEQDERVFPETGGGGAVQLDPGVRLRLTRIAANIESSKRQLNVYSAGFVKDYLARKAAGTLDQMDKGQRSQAEAYLELLAEIDNYEKQWEDTLNAEQSRMRAGATPAELPPGMGAGGGTTNRVGRFEIVTPGTNQPATY